MATRKRTRAKQARERVWWASDRRGHLATFAAAANIGPIPRELHGRDERAFDRDALARRVLELPPSLVPSLDVRRLFASAAEHFQAPTAAPLRSPDPEHQALVELESLALLDDRELLQSFRTASKRRGLIRAVSRRPACVVVRGALPWLAREWNRLGVRRVLAPFELDPLELGVFAYRFDAERGAYQRVATPRGPLLHLELLSHRMRSETLGIARSFADGEEIHTPRWSDHWEFPS